MPEFKITVEGIRKDKTKDGKVYNVLVDTEGRDHRVFDWGFMEGVEVGGTYLLDKEKQGIYWNIVGITPYDAPPEEAEPPIEALEEEEEVASQKFKKQQATKKLVDTALVDTAVEFDRWDLNKLHENRRSCLHAAVQLASAKMAQGAGEITSKEVLQIAKLFEEYIMEVKQNDQTQRI